MQLHGENNSGGTPTAEELTGWADQYGQTIPILADEGWGIENRFRQDNGIPSFTLLAPGAEVMTTDNYGEAMNLIDTVLPENYEFHAPE